jgi:hypothetical protein
MKRIKLYWRNQCPNAPMLQCSNAPMHSLSSNDLYIFILNVLLLLLSFGWQFIHELNTNEECFYKGSNSKQKLVTLKIQFIYYSGFVLTHFHAKLERMCQTVQRKLNELVMQLCYLEIEQCNRLRRSSGYQIWANWWKIGNN